MFNFGIDRILGNKNNYISLSDYQDIGIYR